MQPGDGFQVLAQLKEDNESNIALCFGVSRLEQYEVTASSFSSKSAWNLGCMEPSKARTDNGGKYFFFDYLHDWKPQESQANFTVIIFPVICITESASSKNFRRALRTTIGMNSLASVFNVTQKSGTFQKRDVHLLRPQACAPSPAKKKRLFYAFMFNDEFEILDLLLSELPSDVVDVFLVVESNMTHSGQPKALNFDRTRHRYANETRLKNIAVLDLQPQMTHHEREVYQRDQGVFSALKRFGARPEDYVLVTDADGIVSADALRMARHCAYLLRGTPVAFHLTHFVYNFNWQADHDCKERSLMVTLTTPNT